MSVADVRGETSAYRGRLAPSPTGYLHLGHARTFHIAARRAREHQGVLVYRDEDLDRQRCRPEFAEAAENDLRRLGLSWQEGPDVGGAYGPYRQSERLHIYQESWRRLCAAGWIYPCPHSRADIRKRATRHSDDGEIIFPHELRPPGFAAEVPESKNPFRDTNEPGAMNWRFRVPPERVIHFDDGCQGPQTFRAGVDSGDFLVWRKNGWPTYEFAVVVDDAAMRISEVVRGADLLLSTARQLLIYEALALEAPAFYHCDLVRDADGERLAKRYDSLAIRTLLDAGHSPAELEAMWTAAL